MKTRSRPRIARARRKKAPVVTAVAYLPATDEVEIENGWCCIRVKRDDIEELASVSPKDMQGISLGPSGDTIHLDGSNIQIEAKGLVADVAAKLLKCAALAQ